MWTEWDRQWAQHNLAVQAWRSAHTYVGTITVDGMSGTFTMVGKEAKLAGNWTAQRIPQNKPTSARSLDFNPTEFHRLLSADVPPVLKIWPGDIVRTKSVDAGGQHRRRGSRNSSSRGSARNDYV